MGLLDDAIREHLDLKRARGADPAEIERLEREALGPVRREPTVGAAYYEPPEPEHFEEPIPEPHFPEPNQFGYHDGTAPHAHQSDEHSAPRLDLAGEHGTQDGVEFEADQQPKRRFLRRSRPASLAESQPPVDGQHAGLTAHDEHPEHYGALEGHEPLEDHEPLEGHDGQAAHETIEDGGPAAPAGQAPPPHLEFKHPPPERPRFTAEPPTEAHPVGEEPAHDEHAVPESQAAVPPAPPAPREEPQATREEPQATREFDVQGNFDAEHHDEDEDVLEETPEFLQDTPEHDRLWFEQRPPRDFDFDG